MNRVKRFLSPTAALSLVLAVLAGAAPLNALSAPAAGYSQKRQRARKLYRDGNYKDSYNAYSALALDAGNDPKQVGQDLHEAIQCLKRLARINEIDEFREKVIKTHPKNWRLLLSAARTLRNGTHYGYMIAGEFHRGRHRGGGKVVNASQRDRIRAMQLMTQALGPARQEKDKSAAGSFFLEFADMIMNYRGYSQSWRLQYLSDISKLPDYEDGYDYRYYRGRNMGAPVDEDGNPVFHKLPKSYEDAATDGERWRWMLMQTMETDSRRTNDALQRLASFLHQQFGVQTMARYSWMFRGRWGGGEEKDEDSIYALHTLKETETMARLATGVKRFDLPNEFNFVRILNRIADEPKTGHGENSLNTLAQIFENRRQYPRAAEYWRRTIQKYGAGHNQWKQKRLDQIVRNWGRFESAKAQPAGKGAEVGFRFRNGNKVSLEAHEVDMKRLLDDVKAYIKSKPRKLDWNRMQIDNIGYQLVKGNAGKYLRAKVASWDLKLEPRKKHFDRQITVTTPLQKPGAYWVVARMANGNTSHIVLWVHDTVIVKKRLDKGAYYFVADAVTGKPIPKANVEFFGYRQKWVRRNTYDINVWGFAEFTDENGQIKLGGKKLPSGYSWIVIATTKDGRFAHQGFSGIWTANYHDREYHSTKVYVITDRPVYRPEHKVKFKFWVRHAKYDKEDVSSFGNRSFLVEIYDPQRKKIHEKTVKTDEFGGFDSELALAADATLGGYRINIIDPNHVDQATGKRVGRRHLGNGYFRVEEYKKPEFEVSIDAPSEPVMLGEKITATIKAKYYFGAPVTKAKVKYKVTRANHSAAWYPPAPWDWFYGIGYWWFAYDYVWYPGWHYWGCKRPWPWWWHRSYQAPEIVSEAEVKIGEDGTVKVEIDTAMAKAVHGDIDHKYSITAEVVDESRRTIVGNGSVLVARKPYKVYAWTHNGYYRVGDTVHAEFSARRLDEKPVQGKAEIRLLKISYAPDGTPAEKVVEEWESKTDVEGKASLQLKAAEPGQYRLSCTVMDTKDHKEEGAYIFTVAGEGFKGEGFRFNEIELMTDKKDYKPGEKVRLMVNTEQRDSTVVLFVRPSNGVCLPPEVIRLDGKSVIREIAITKKDMPNFFVEAFTINNGRHHTETREIIVPPEKRVLNVEVQPSEKSYKPGQKAEVKVKLTDFFGKPFIGSVVMAIYDKSVEYISGGSNVGDIKTFFWKWRRRHRPYSQTTMTRRGTNLVRPKAPGMSNLGVFGHVVAQHGAEKEEAKALEGRGRAAAATKGFAANRTLRKAGAPMAVAEAAAAPGKADMDMLGARMNGAADKKAKRRGYAAGGGGAGPDVQPVVRTKFADTAFWAGSLATDKDGLLKVDLTMPENLTGWKIRTWALGHGTKVGEGATEVVTAKNLMLRMQAPRFFVEKDEVVLSANVHNYLEDGKSVKAVLELTGESLEVIGKPTQTVDVKANGEQRVDWRVKVLKEGEAVVTMKALTDEESDAMQMKFPVYVHGMLKTESWSGMIPADKNSGSLSCVVPKERRPDQSRLEIRYSPTLAGALVDALPYLAAYPYRTTDVTLNRFLPTVLTQKILIDMGLDLKDIKKKRTNLNAQEIGDAKERARQWKRWDHDAVFDNKIVERMVKENLRALYDMQLSDGGWGWFSGWGEHSTPHMTAYVVHGLQVARENDVAIIPGVIDRGVKWLQRYQEREVRKLKNTPKKIRPWKSYASNMDAFVFMVLVDAGIEHKDMLEFLYRDRTRISVYAKAMYGIALHKKGHKEKLALIMQNIEQYLVEDDENQSAWLKLPNGGYWWWWYGSEMEAHAYYLKLLSRVEPKSRKASRLVKYILNNRKHATYWNSTRDTALCIEAMAEYLRASGEDKPDMTVQIFVDGKKLKEVKINAQNLFSFDGTLLLKGDAVETGKHKVELRKEGTGPLYFNAYLTNFTLEDHITRAGLEVKVDRKIYKLVKVDKKIKAAGSRGQVLDQKVEKYERKELANLDKLKSGDLVEIELTIQSKNDYEYIMIEDMKAAGFEPVDVRSGYNGNDLGAYMELRDERVAFFKRALARGKHSVSYRMRAEIPGRFSALSAKISAVYAPELKGNSDEIKLRIED